MVTQCEWTENEYGKLNEEKLFRKRRQQVIDSCSHGSVSNAIKVQRQTSAPDSGGREAFKPRLFFGHNS